jgi:hypothetical protein
LHLCVEIASPRDTLADPDAIACKPTPVQDGRIHIEKINGPFRFQLKGTPAEYKAGPGSRHRQWLAVAA